MTAHHLHEIILLMFTIRNKEIEQRSKQLERPNNLESDTPIRLRQGKRVNTRAEENHTMALPDREAAVDGLDSLKTLSIHHEILPRISKLIHQSIRHEHNPLGRKVPWVPRKSGYTNRGRRRELEETKCSTRSELSRTRGKEDMEGFSQGSY